MADNTAITPGSGETIRDKDRSGVKTQIVGLDLGIGTGSESLMSGSLPVTSTLLPAALSSNGGLLVRASLLQVNIALTPTVSTSPAYTIGDALGGLLTFANAARASGGSGLIQAVTVMCKTPALVPALDLYLFNQTFTATSDNAAFAPSDGDMANCIGVIPIAAWAAETASSLNSIATRFGLAFPFLLTGTSLFGQLVTRAAFTAAGTSDFVIGIQVLQD